MIHTLGMIIVHAMFQKLDITLVWPIDLTICFLVIIITAYLVYHYFETPISMFFKNLNHD